MHTRVVFSTTILSNPVHGAEMKAITSGNSYAARMVYVEYAPLQYTSKLSEDCCKTPGAVLQIPILKIGPILSSMGRQELPVVR